MLIKEPRQMRYSHMSRPFLFEKWLSLKYNYHVMDKNKENKKEEFNNTEEVSKITEEAAVNAEETEKKKTEESNEAIEKPTKAQRFFNVMDKGGDLFFLNIYFTITCIPIITIGAAITALYTVTNKMVNDKEANVKEQYFEAFKSNFKQSTTIWIVDLIYIAIMYLQYCYVVTNSSDAARYLMVFLGFEFVLAAFAIPLQFPLVARYENTTWNLIKNALVFSLAYLGTWFRMFFIWVFPAVLYWLNPKIFIYTWFIWALFLTTFFAYACSVFLVKFYEKLEAPKE